ncbi:alpha/beta hydrolase family protein [Thalassomonas actiniarum]|uniref:Alpha/beta fold hydrolase n=1 Tax=Thalassomonas actiniarum TaxID=485447 RepID=A0AAE9YW97_9GAMM|nr:alpha/beta fold hydrolase [Thalassomonas actiniarum]WDE01534.1 alpha/beta fold hydrolase [Thalassomonas actiniarum]
MRPLLLLFCLIISIFTAVEANAKAQGKYPASIVELTIPSHGKRMSGLAYLAEGAGPHPTILLLHGYPGNEKNLDVAQAMRSEGWNVIFFHYRGAWGSEGEFSFRGAEQDVQQVLAYLRHEENAASLRIKADKISLVGHSMGGHMAIAGLLDNPAVKCSLSYDGANLGADGLGFFKEKQSAALWRSYSDSLFMLSGWSGAKAEAEIRQYGPELDLVKRIGTINGRPVMLIAANTEVIPMAQHIKPLLAALTGTQNSRVFYQLIEDDHSFSSSRDQLIAASASFLNGQCR